VLALWTADERDLGRRIAIPNHSPDFHKTPSGRWSEHPLPLRVLLNSKPTLGNAAAVSLAEYPYRHKEESIRLRMSTADKQALMEAAARDGLTLSAWLRQLALRAAGALPGRR